MNNVIIVCYSLLSLLMIIMADDNNYLRIVSSIDDMQMMKTKCNRVGIGALRGGEDSNHGICNRFNCCHKIMMI